MGDKGVFKISYNDNNSLFFIHIAQSNAQNVRVVYNITVYVAYVQAANIQCKICHESIMRKLL